MIEGRKHASSSNETLITNSDVITIILRSRSRIALVTVEIYLWTSPFIILNKCAQPKSYSTNKNIPQPNSTTRHNPNQQHVTNPLNSTYLKISRYRTMQDCEQYSFISDPDIPSVAKDSCNMSTLASRSSSKNRYTLLIILYMIA